MKITAVVLMLGLMAGSVLADPPVDVSSLPPAVQQAINNAKGQGEIKKVKPTRVNGQAAYEVELKNKGDEKQILVAQDGSLIQKQGQGYAKGKGKGKAKGRNKDRYEAPESTGAVQAPAPAAPVGSTDAPKAPTPAASAPAPATTAPAPARQSQASASSTSSRSAAEVRTELGKRVSRINTLDNNPQMASAGLSAIAKETGVSLSTLQAQLKEYPVGSGGLLVCNELAKATRKPASTFLKQRLQNRDWDRIAAENKFDLSSVLPKLDRVQAQMEAAGRRIKK